MDSAFYTTDITCDNGFLVDIDVVGVGSSKLTLTVSNELTSDSSSDTTLVFFSVSNLRFSGTVFNLNTPPCCFSVSYKGFKTKQPSGSRDLLTRDL